MEVINIYFTPLTPLILTFRLLGIIHTRLKGRIDGVCAWKILDGYQHKFSMLDNCGKVLPIWIGEHKSASWRMILQPDLPACSPSTTLGAIACTIL